MVRNVFRRLERLEARVAASTPDTIQIRVLLVHPEEGVTEVLVIEGDMPTRKVPPTPEEVESVRADLEARRAARLPWKGDPTDTHDYARLKQLETRAKEVAAARPEPHSFCFIEPVNKRVTSTLTWENGKPVWMHFDPPRDQAEFVLIV